MTTEEQIRSAQSPQAAMLVLARALDRIEAKLDAPPSVHHVDPWTIPINWVSPEEAAAKYGTPAVDTTELRARIQQETDPDERRALEAQLRLAEDNGEAVRTELPDSGIRPEITVTEGGVTLDVPPVGKERQDRRRRIATDIDISGYLSTNGALTKEEAADAYARGGPMWLYTYDRDAVLQMPLSWRKEMVQDIDEDNPALAHELGRDILKDRGPGDDMDTQIERQLQVRD